MHTPPRTQPTKQPHATPVAANLPLAQESTANASVRALLARYRESFQRSEPAGIVLCFATNASLLEGMLTIAEGFLFGDSLLSRRHKEMIATYLSRRNACSYCADSHATLLGAQGGSPALIDAMQRGDLCVDAITDAESALLTFANKVNASSSLLTRADVEDAMRAGWTKEQVAETVHISALFAAFNRIANGFGLPSAHSELLANSNRKSEDQ